jgi:zinc protease
MNRLPLRRVVGVIGMALILGAAGRPAAAEMFNPDTFTLANGMQVVVVPNHRIPVVNHMVWYRVGAADEPAGRSGIAHLLEHLMFKGTATTEAGEFSRIVARHGGRENAFTGSDFTAYFQTVARAQLETVMTLEADRMRNLVFAAEEVTTERSVVQEERRQRVDNDPGAVLGEHVDATLFFNHPYRRPIIGWEPELATLTEKDALDFYSRWYAPNNAILVVAGDVTADEVRPLAERIYGGIAPTPDLRRQDWIEPPQSAPRRVDMRDEKVRQPLWRRTYLAPSAGTGPREQTDALEIASAILGEGATSRLYRRLVVEDKLAVSAGSSYSATARGPATFSVYASPRPGVTTEVLETAVDAVLRDFIDNGVGDDEMARAKTVLLANAVYARDSLSAGAYALGQALAIGLSVDDVELWPERIAAVTADQVAAAASAVFHPDRSVTATLMPADGASGGRP